MSADAATATPLRVLVATPTAENHVKTHHASSLFHLAQDFARRGIACEHASLTWSDLEMARNMLASRALSGGFTHILFIDSDIGFRPQAVVRLLAANKPLIGATYAQKNLDVLALVNAASVADQQEKDWQRKLVSRHTRFNGRPPKKDGEAIVEAVEGVAKFQMVGMGLTLIACAALQAMVDKTVAAQQRHPTGTKAVDHPVYGFFNRLSDADGNLISEDYSFCLRWQRCGGEIFALIDEPILHVGSYIYSGRFSETLERKI